MSRIKITDTDHSQVEINVSKKEELSDLLNNSLREQARVVIIELPDMGFFTLGIGMPYGFIQFSKDNEPPYLVALDDESTLDINPNDEVEFDSGGTITPIPKGLCLRFERVVEIIAYCFSYRKLPRWVTWKEI